MESDEVALTRSFDRRSKGVDVRLPSPCGTVVPSRRWPMAPMADPGVAAGRRPFRLLVAVLVVAAGTVGVAGLLRSQDRSENVRAAATGEPEASWRAVFFHGVEVRVPEEWPIGAIECGTPSADTVIVDLSMVSACLGPAPAEPVTVVWVDSVGRGLSREAQDLATDQTFVDGAPARRGGGVLPGGNARVAVLVVPSRDVAITVESDDTELATRILGTVRLQDIDRHGCPAVLAPQSARHPAEVGGAADQLVPGSPVGVTECRYDNGLLEGSAPPPTAEGLARLVRLLDTLPPGSIDPPPGFDGGCPPGQDGCSFSTPRVFVLTFEYANGQRLPVEVRIAGPGQIQATNGVRSSQPSTDLVTHLIDRLGYDSAFPDPRTYP
jgi:hypothetical protein